MPFVTPFDLSSVLQAAQGYSRLKMAREDREFERQEHMRKIELARKEQEMMVKVKQVQAKAFLAQQPEAQAEAMAELAALDPKTAMETQGFVDKRAAEESERGRTAGLESARAVKQALTAYASAPEETRDATLNREIMRLGGLSREGIIRLDPKQILQIKASPPAPGSPRFEGMMADLDATIGLLEGPEKRQRYNAELEQIGGMAFEEAGGVNDYEWQVQHNPEAVERARAKVEAVGLGRAKAAGTNINVSPRIQMPGTAEPTRQVETDLQTQAAMLDDVVGLIDTIEGDVTPESFTFLGRGKAFMADKAQQAGLKISPEMEQRIEEQQTVASDATFMTYQLIVAWSGKAVTDRERALLFSAIGDPQKMGYARYKAALRALKNMALTSGANKRRALRFGIDTTLNENERRMIDSSIQAVEKRRLAGEIDDAEAIEEMEKVGRMFETRVRLASRRSKRGQQEQGKAKQDRAVELARKIRDGTATSEDRAEAAALTEGP